MNKRVAVIGAGPSGLAQLRAFKSAADKGADIPEIVCFEKQADWGGLWNYTWRTGLDEHGEPVHGSMYRYLWSNGPKECLEFADYTFEEHFGRPIGSYPPRAVLWDYIKGRVEKVGRAQMGALQHARCAWSPTPTRRRNSPSPRMTAPTTSPMPRSSTMSSSPPAISRRPTCPYFEGFATFNGRILHSHDFRDAHRVQGQGHPDHRPQLFGRGHRLAMLEIRREIGHRPATARSRWASNGRRTGRRCRCCRRSSARPRISRTARPRKSTPSSCAPAICTTSRSCTEDLRLKTANRMWPLGLYKGVVWEKNPKLFYIGMQDQFYTFNMFDAQAWFARDVIMGRIKLPSAEAMAEAQREMARARGDARGCRADDLVPGRLRQGADRGRPTIRASTSRRPTRPSWSGSTTRSRTS